MNNATDNIQELYELFDLSIDKKYAGGSAWVCKQCNIQAHSEEGWFPCQNAFVPVRVWCNDCRRKWRLQINLNGDFIRT